MDIHNKLLNAIMRHDERESKKPGFNRYALPQYLQALADTDELIKKGSSTRAAILSCFNGRLCDKLLKAVNEPLMTRDETRGY